MAAIDGITYATLAVGVLTLLLATLNFLAHCGSAASTLRAAPAEAREALADLREQILEEREALRQQTRELRLRRRLFRARGAGQQHPAHAGRARGGLSAKGSVGNLLLSASASSVALQGQAPAMALTFSEQTLSLHYQTVRDIWRRFRVLEEPFLMVGGGSAGGGGGGGGAGAGAGVSIRVNPVQAWSEDVAAATNEKAVHQEDIEMHGDASSGPEWSVAYRCGLAQRIVWWRTKDEVLALADQLNRVMMRRMEKEVSSVRMMLRQVRDGGDGPEELASPLLDGALAWGGLRSRNASQVSIPLGLGLGMRMRPIGETSNVYESTEESSDGSTRMRRPPAPAPAPAAMAEEREPRVGAAEARLGPQGQGQGQGRPSTAGGRIEYEGKASSDGRRHGFIRPVDMTPRVPYPAIPEMAREPRLRSRPSFERRSPGPPSPRWRMW